MNEINKNTHIPCEVVKYDIHGDVVYCIYCDLYAIDFLQDGDLILNLESGEFAKFKWSHVKEYPYPIRIVISSNHPKNKKNVELIDKLLKKNKLFDKLVIQKKFLSYHFSTVTNEKLNKVVKLTLHRKHVIKNFFKW